MSFQIDFDVSILKIFALIFFLAVLAQVISFVIAKIAYNHYSPDKKKVFQYATLVSNSGFLGNPVAEGVYGATGLMYAAIYCIPTRIVMWSAGLSLFTDNQDKKAAVKKVLLHPCMVAVYIGMFFMASGLPIPEMIKNTVDSIGKCTTPLTMILIGCIIAEVDNLKSMVNRHVIYFTIIRIVIIPGLVFLLCKLFSADPVITGVSVLLSGMPAGSTAAILAAKYGGDYITGTKLVVFSTIMTLFSIPVWCFLIGS